MDKLVANVQKMWVGDSKSTFSTPIASPTVLSPMLKSPVLSGILIVLVHMYNIWHYFVIVDSIQLNTDFMHRLWISLWIKC